LLSPLTNSGERIALTSGLVVGYLHNMAALRGCGWKQAVLTLALLSEGSDTEREKGAVRVLDRMCHVGPNTTWNLYGACIDEVQVGVDTDPLMGTATLGMDMAGRIDPEGGVDMWRAARLQYGAAITGHMLGYISAIGTWRVQPTPVAPIGSATVAPVVVGNLYDQATSYVLSQRMAAAFPESSIITYQGVGHCLEYPDAPTNIDPLGTGECHELIVAYLRTGVRPLNGHTCRMQTPIPVPTSLEV